MVTAKCMQNFDCSTSLLDGNSVYFCFVRCAGQINFCPEKFVNLLKELKMLISIALALLATANGLSLKLKKRKIRTKRDFSAKSLSEEKVRWERDTDMMDNGVMESLVNSFLRPFISHSNL